MVPAELMPSAVAMLADTLSEHLDLLDELLTRHLLDVFVHTVSPGIGRLCLTARSSPSPSRVLCSALVRGHHRGSPTTSVAETSSQRTCATSGHPHSSLPPQTTPPFSFSLMV